MWPFKKKQPRPALRKQVHELIVDESYDIKNCPPYIIRVGISHYEDSPECNRVFFKLSHPFGHDLSVYPRQHDMPREAAIQVANEWAHALRVTYDVGSQHFKEAE